MQAIFSNVGREHKSWTAEVKSLSDRELIRSIRDNNALMSRGIEFAWNEEGSQAQIIVGMVRTVGYVAAIGGRKV